MSAKLIIALISINLFSLNGSFSQRAPSLYVKTDTICKQVNNPFRPSITKKIIFIDNVYTTDSTKILNPKSVILWSQDAGDYLRLHRLVVHDTHIFEFQSRFHTKFGKIKIFNQNGKLIKSEKLPKEELHSYLWHALDNQWEFVSNFVKL